MGLGEGADAGSQHWAPSQDSSLQGEGSAWPFLSGSGWAWGLGPGPLLPRASPHPVGRLCTGRSRWASLSALLTGSLWDAHRGEAQAQGGLAGAPSPPALWGLQAVELEEQHTR